MGTKETRAADPSKRSRRGRWIFGGIVLALVGLWIVVLTSLGYETLIAKAALVTKWQTQPNRSAQFIPGQAGYILDHHWMSDGSLLRIPFSLPSPFQRPQAISTKLERVDPKTGAVLSTKAVALGSAQRSTLNEPSLSPDGKWLLLEDSGDIALIDTETGAVRPLLRGGYGKDCLEILALMRQSQIETMERWKPGVQGKNRPMNAQYLSLADRVAWARDSQSFFEVKQSRVAPYHLQQRTLDDKIVLDLPLNGFSNAGIPQILGQTHTGEILLVDRNWLYANSLLFVNLQTGRMRPAPIKELPPGLLLKQVEMSPDGARILWKTVNVNPPVMEALSLMAAQVAKSPLQFQVSIKVTDLEGAQAHDIAAERMDKTEEDGFRTVHWLPDSKRVSLWYKGSLYTIPAP